MRVSDHMRTDVVYLSVPGTREEALAVMAEKQVQSLPIVKKGTKKLVGVVTRTDLLKMADENQLAMLVNRDAMTVEMNTDLRKAAQIMMETGHRNLPVVDNEELVGVISVLDILHVTLDNEEYDKRPIKDLVTRHVTAVWDQTPVPIAYMMMEMAGRHAIVTINSAGGVTGLVGVSEFIHVSEVLIEDDVASSDSGTGATVEWGWSSKNFLLVTKKVLKLPNVPIEKIVPKNTISVSEVTSVAECVRVLYKNRLEQVPVLSAAGSLAGLVEDLSFLPLAIETLGRL